MILMNLLESEAKQKRDHTIPFALGFLILLLVSLFFVTLREDSVAAVRPLQIEEKEILISAMERLQVDVPQFQVWAAELNEELIKSSLSIFVSGDRSLAEKHMVEVSEAGIAVSPLFFSSDPISQESSLIYLITEKNSPLKAPSEIAVIEE